ncbi:hypothetical protein PUNSTDRAFT_145230 [Punctularia strigosozonata HHB-11173 SS5]|uniref:uncharacterized protein n=1 Tax=Punctularia strigosozonata (strain HHB-11173) TaxID=741275 RepID=UPI0004416A4D|nr:uncharacterized protein PUNSTDRAFT_145230 [Punctularia strigosozonata HHB-11173 SS5]EIN06717.1 hypothetical protein PUNSTDRAFT_145230 [Punctularia strigosozonata HHB-11173 SS5]
MNHPATPHGTTLALENLFASSSTSSTPQHTILKRTLNILLVVPDPATAAGAQAVNRSSVASLAFLVWDILITTDDEVRLMWPRSWSYTKYLYFFVRYFAACVQITILFVGTEISRPFDYTPHACFAWQVWQGVAALALGIAVDCILILRLHALYNRSARVRAVLFALFVAELLGMAVSLGLGVGKISFDDDCTVTSWPIEFVAYGVFPLVFQGILFGFTVWQFVKTMRHGWGRTRVLDVLMRDGMWAFFLIFFVYLLQGIVFLLPSDGAFTGVFYAWLLTAFSFSGYRLLLNIQRLAPQHSRARSNPTGRSTDFTSTHMDFATNATPSGGECYRTIAGSSTLASGAATTATACESELAVEGSGIDDEGLEIEMLPVGKRSVAFDLDDGEGGRAAGKRRVGWDDRERLSPRPHR